MACGDGYVDGVAGEQCDPLVAESFEGRCGDTPRALGESACDPDTCQIVTDAVQCGVCGDGIVDAAALGEECEPGVAIEASCPHAGQMRCVDCRLDDSGCEECGNGIVEGTEACDPEPGFIQGSGSLCEGMPVPGRPELTYESGRLHCAECQIDLTECGLCGNGVVDLDPILSPVTGVQLRPGEVCDTGFEDKAALAAQCATVCGVPAVPGLECAHSCPRCIEFEVVADGDPQCCIADSMPRASGMECCCTLSGACGPIATDPEVCPMTLSP